MYDLKMNWRIDDMSVQLVNKLSENSILDFATILVSIRCAICNSTLKILSTTGSYPSITVIPCERCLAKPRENLQQYIDSIVDISNKESAKRVAAEEAKHKDLEDKVYKEFESRFRKLMKKASK